MVEQEAVIKRIHNGGTRSVKALKRQLDYLSRQSDPERQNVQLVSSAQLQFEDDDSDDINSPDNINNNIEKIAKQLFRRSGRLPADDPDAELPHDLTIHFVMSFPQGTDIEAAKRAGHDWAICVFGRGYRNAKGYVQRHKFYAAYHPPYEHDDNPNPHMHVVVDRSPRGGGNLLTLKRGHPHWSYEAMRFQAVEAAANHGIELAATTRAARGLAERALTDVEIRRRRRLMTRPTTRTEDMRRRQQAAELEYSDDEYDDHGFAPLSGDQAVFPRSHDNQGGSGEDGDVEMQEEDSGAQLTAGNLQILQGQFFAERQRGNAEGAPQRAQDGPAPDGSGEPSVEILLEKRRRETRKDRRQALQALRNHRANTDNIAEESTMDWREEDRHLLRKARLALIEHRTAFAGQTNVTTHAQAVAAIGNGQQPENDRHVDNRGKGSDEPRLGRRFPGADPDHSR